MSDTTKNAIDDGDVRRSAQEPRAVKKCAFQRPQLPDRELTAEDLRAWLTYDPETGEFRWKTRISIKSTIGKLAGRINATTRYLDIGIRGRRYGAHRLAWLYVYGEWPRGMIDHINCVRSDNRIANLREANDAVNHANVVAPQRNSTTGLRGVTPGKCGGFVAATALGGKYRYLGTFDSAEEAHAVYTEARLSHLNQSLAASAIKENGKLPESAITKE